MGIYKNFVEQNGTGTGDTILLGAVVGDSLSFALSFADNDSVSYAIEDDTGRKVVGVGVFSSTNNTLTRSDTWSYNGAVIDNDPSTNIVLSSGTHRVICTQNASQLDGLELLVLAGQANGLATLDGTGKLPVAQLPSSTSTFGEHFAYDYDATTSITTSVVAQTKSTLNTPAVPVGQVMRIAWSYNWAYDSASSDFIGTIEVDGLIRWTHRQETKDSAGNTAGRGTDQELTASGVFYHTSTTGLAIPIDLNWRSQANGIKSSLWNVTIEAWRVA